ncbi:ATP-dependent DNA helicase [Amaricoccus solimangrovi]|uniref:ATPase n=1 Tax=Amaricoccus solimangrovi TaxID=2589815 RepID=A0A501WJP1_9RHOB|nr:AAA family ATPase [Amaricoccus solimangrovi]TPE49739.1 ATPase [Amaricoccus solimangrovi]
MELSADQARARTRILAALAKAGVDLDLGTVEAEGGRSERLAVLGKAGSGKTLLLSEIVRGLMELGLRPVTGDFESRNTKARTFCVLAPTNKAAGVLRGRGVPATTIHRVLYTPLYHPDYEAIAEWLTGEGERPAADTLSDEALDRAKAFYARHPSIPGALAAAGLRGSDFIKGWKRREQPLDIGLIDEASMLDATQFEDLGQLFSTLVLFGDPAQLAPVGGGGGMVFDAMAEDAKLTLGRVHRQAADNPILDLAHALGDPDLEFEAFEDLIHAAAARDDRVVVAQRADAVAMARAPVLVWRNATRVRLIQGFRAVHGAPSHDLIPGEPLICDGIELPLRHRRKRMDLEARGLIKGAQAIYLGPGRKPGFSRLHLPGSEEGDLSVASIIQIEVPGAEEPIIPTAASMGVLFLHGAAVTIHKAQGSQWPEVQVFAPDLFAAARAGRVEAGIALWKRLAYVAITRAEHRLHWVTRYMLSRPTEPLGTDDLVRNAPILALEAEG